MKQERSLIAIGDFKPFVDMGVAVWSERSEVTKRELQFRQKAAKAIQQLGYAPVTVLQYRSLSRDGFISKNCLCSFTLIQNAEVSVYGKRREDLKKHFAIRKSDSKPVQLNIFEEK
jgi:hypothetical protein